MAAGLGTRMKSANPKVLHTLCGRPMLAYVLDAWDEAVAETASASAVVPMKPPWLIAVAVSISNPLPTKPRMPRSVVFGARNPRVYLPAISNPPYTLTTAPMRPEKAPKRLLSSGNSGSPFGPGSALLAREVYDATL